MRDLLSCKIYLSLEIMDENFTDQSIETQLVDTLNFLGFWKMTLLNVKASIYSFYNDSQNEKIELKIKLNERVL